MTPRIFFETIFILAISLVGCNSHERKTADESFIAKDNKVDSFFQQRPKNANEHLCIIYDDSLINSMPAKIAKNTLWDSVLTGPYNRDSNTTVTTYAYRKTIVNVFQHNDSFGPFVRDGIICDSGVDFGKGIQIGMSRSDFKDSLGVNYCNQDTVYISGSSDIFYIMVSFKKDVISGIKFISTSL